MPRESQASQSAREQRTGAQRHPSRPRTSSKNPSWGVHNLPTATTSNSHTVYHESSDGSRAFVESIAARYTRSDTDFQMRHARLTDNMPTVSGGWVPSFEYGNYGSDVVGETAVEGVTVNRPRKVIFSSTSNSGILTSFRIRIQPSLKSPQ